MFRLLLPRTTALTNKFSINPSTLSILTTPTPITSNINTLDTTTPRTFATAQKRRRLGKRADAINAKRELRRAEKRKLLEEGGSLYPPVINAPDREQLRREAEVADALAAEEMKKRITTQPETPLRFDMTGLEMSDRVKKLFDLTLGNQREIVKVQKQRGMELFQLREGDTGSSAVQVVALTTRIQQMQAHMKTHRKDFSGRRGLDRMYVRRRKLLDYMERKDFDSYRRVVKTLGLLR